MMPPENATTSVKATAARTPAKASKIPMRMSATMMPTAAGWAMPSTEKPAMAPRTSPAIGSSLLRLPNIA